ncbi:response regulator transcription factor [Nocardia brasiliensis]|uniref:response regulator transcription factor n=1 Tax=Nocardia brasiliensis TaxID=37326 RepID=UPI001E2A530E|nr:response regulator transcription factor [Nocardia brasiliensis]
MTDPVDPSSGGHMSSTAGVRIGVVEDHELLIDGLRQALGTASDLMIVAAAESVSSLLSLAVSMDMVVLDLSLPDASTPLDNIEQLRSAGIGKVLVLTTGDRPDLVREAARAGVLGVVRKSESAQAICDAVRSAAGNQPIGTIDWAAAIDCDPSRPRLAPREEEVLALYAAGESADEVAALMKISKNTVNQYLTRIRVKYAAAGSPVASRADLRYVARRDGFVSRLWWRRRK